MHRPTRLSQVRLPAKHDRWTLGFGSASLILLLVLVAFFWRPLLLGEIFYPHDNARELGIPASEDTAPAAKPSATDARLSNRNFSDQSSQFVPELHQHLAGRHEGWISTWNPHVELGRPTGQLGASSKAFWLTHALSWFSSDAFVVYTWLVMLATGGAAFFALLWLRGEGLHPAASLAAAIALGLGVYTAYWSTFALFLFGICWTLAWLWLIRRTLTSPDPFSILGIIVTVQALLLSAYPQQIIWHLWFVAIYTLHAAARSEGGWRAQTSKLVWIGIASALGVVSAAPVYLDLALDAARSARLEVPTEFFLGSLPAVENLGDLLAQCAQIVDVGVFGNPIDPAHAPGFNGFSLTPLLACGLAASFAGDGLRRFAPLHLFVGVTFVMTFVSAFYVFGVEYLGLSLSRFTPSTAALIPAALLAGHGFDAVLRRRVDARWLAGGFAVGVCVLLAITGATASTPFEAGGVFVTTVMALLVLVCVLLRSAPMLVVVACLGVFVHAQPLLLLRPPADVHRDSQLVQEIGRASESGDRYAWVDRWIVPPNQEVMLDLRSVHTYNSLSSQAYQDWTRRISERGTTMHGRYFSAIVGDARLTSEALRRAGVGVLVAPRRLDPALAYPVARSGRVFIHRTRVAPIHVERTTLWRREEAGGVALVDAAHANTLAIREVEATDDRSRLSFEARDDATLVWLSRQYHPRWRARSEGRRLETVIVDDLYLGVVVPAGATTIVLDFESFVRLAWLPQVALLLGFAGCAAWRARQAGREAG